MQLPRHVQVVGLSGQAGTGKTFVAEQVLRTRGFYPVALADELKVRAVLTGAATFEDAFYHKPPHVRQWLQEEGTERGRDVFGQDCWVRALAARLRLVSEMWGLTKFVVTDIRFPNEVEAVKAAGGKVWRVHAPVRASRSPLTMAARRHPSETALDTYRAFDGYVFNDDGTTVYELARQVDALLVQVDGGVAPE